jgi:hypothetical protein
MYLPCGKYSANVQALAFGKRAKFRKLFATQKAFILKME